MPAYKDASATQKLLARPMSLHDARSAAADTIEQATTEPAGESISRKRMQGMKFVVSLIVLQTTGNRVRRDPFEGSEASHGKNH